jgi:hypothetical protein
MSSLSPDLIPLVYIFWGHIMDSVYVPPLSTTLPQFAGRTRATAPELQPPLLQMYGLNLNRDKLRAGLLIKYL